MLAAHPALLFEDNFLIRSKITLEDLADSKRRVRVDRSVDRVKPRSDLKHLRRNYGPGADNHLLIIANNHARCSATTASANEHKSADKTRPDKRFMKPPAKERAHLYP